MAPALLGSARSGKRALAVDDAERVQLRLQRVDPVEQQFRRLDRRQVVLAVKFGQRRR
jgi:hypothetical protein